jgi:hypothetical protein
MWTPEPRNPPASAIVNPFATNLAVQNYPPNRTPTRVFMDGIDVAVNTKTYLGFLVRGRDGYVLWLHQFRGYRHIWQTGRFLRRVGDGEGIHESPQVSLLSTLRDH